GSQLGIMETGAAVMLAKSKGLDLIEISPNAQPPVCKILDFGKFQYDESKKNKQSGKSQVTKVKEIKLRVGVDQNDYNTKIRHAIEFLTKGYKLKVTLMFRGRELARTEFGFEVMKRFIKDLSEYGTSDCEPKLFGKMISVTVSPLSAQKRSIQAQQKKEAQPIKILNASELLEL
ncbi:MAG: translation initiation factor IF-3, partial [Opitutales bacterium]|nr:translation initiation factor IF-3 [Opitutales bacterium]